MNTQTQSSALRPERVKVVTLLENAACREGLASAHGLSLYLETPRHRILFDMGPDGAFVENAAALGVDLKTVDLAVLSHGHYDHGGGLAAFCRCNDTARIYIRRDAFGEFLSADPGQEPHYIGLPEDLELFRERFVLTGPETKIDEELTLFACWSARRRAYSPTRFPMNRISSLPPERRRWWWQGAPTGAW